MGTTSARGGCFCGAVRFEIELPTLYCAHCHCSMCRRAHGAGFVTWVGVPRSQFRTLGGDDALVHYRSSEHGTRGFCGICGSTLFCESTRHADRVDVVLANIDGPIDRTPQLHAYFDNRADWIALDDRLPRLNEDGSPG